MATTITDPRERLVSVGNELLDAIYKLQETDGLQKEIEAAKGDDEASKAIFDNGGLEKILERITAMGTRDRKLAEYTVLRQTIEALTR